MDKRIGYGLPFEKAVEMAIKQVADKAVHFSFSTRDHDVVWAELREDGWRVYSNVEGAAEEESP